MNILSRAIVFAIEKHTGQYRKNSELPYIVHPLNVMSKLMEFTKDEDLLSAAILHDVVEDSGVTEIELHQKFNCNVARYVGEATKTKENYAGKNRSEKWAFYLNCLREYSENGKILKLADRICNLREYIADWNLLTKDEKYFVYTIYSEESMCLYNALFTNEKNSIRYKLLDELNNILFKIPELI